jgi:hypothetical protein
MLGMAFVAPRVAIRLAYLLGIRPALCAALVNWYLSPRLSFAMRVHGRSARWTRGKDGANF